MRMTAALALVAASLPSVAPAFTSLCVEEASTGYNWREGRWVETTFSTTNYIARELKRGDELAEQCFYNLDLQGAVTEPTFAAGSEPVLGCYAIHDVGEDAVFGNTCRERWSDGELKAVECQTGFFAMSFSPSGEFVRTQTYPVPAWRDELVRDSLILSHGKCSVIAP